MRALAINEHGQIIGDNCVTDCGLRAPQYASKYAVPVDTAVTRCKHLFTGLQMPR